MKGGGSIYPNKGIKMDPRALTSIRMPESLKVYCGYLNEGFKYLRREGILTLSDFDREYNKIQSLIPLQETKNKLHSSHWFHSETYLIEFFRTSSYNYKIYALRISFPEEENSLFRQ
jgi:CTP:phosphocholine cytidylyltransferase-like protein